MIFADMPYERPDIESLAGKVRNITAALRNAAGFAEAEKAFLDMDNIERHVSTLHELSTIRHSINTKDEFYDEEEKFWNKAMPELQEYMQEYNVVLVESPFAKELEEKYGDVVFKNIRLSIRSFSPELIPLLQKENDLRQEYDKLIANALVKFEGKEYPLTLMGPFRNDPDDARRLSAWKAEGQWYKNNQPALDRIYDDLVKVRTECGRLLGHEDYTELGYDRMERNCYRKDDVERFRTAVVRYLVPLAERLMKEQAARMVMQYPLSFSDMQLEFRDGNPRPAGGEEYIVEQAQEFYDALSPETGEFFRIMRENELMDLTSREGKENGGYCTGLPEYGVPFIFANFNGTQHDVEVVTHEAGHAFAYYVNRNNIPVTTCWPGMEGAEVHSMSMEFFAWPWAEKFFGKDTKKYLYSHLKSAITFIPYGTMVDHFQHEVYAHPEMTPKERHAVWKRLLGIYMPWVRLDGDIPFYADGEGWQRQSHIYEVPFYYIDYCLAQTVSLQFWALIMKDVNEAFRKYMAYTSQGGKAVFTELLANAGLESPFDENCLKQVSSAAAAWLDRFDLKEV